MKTLNRRRAVAFVLVLLGICFFLDRGYHDERITLSLRDFKQPYASARCLLEGCNPYSAVDTLRVYTQAGGPDNDYDVIEKYSALYPPFSFALLTPIGALSFPHAAIVWMAIIAALFSAAVVCIALVCMRLAPLSSAGLLALLTATSTILLMLGQMTGPVVALLGIGFSCLLLGWPAAVSVVCFTTAALLKPHDAAFLLLYLLFATRPWRRVFLWTLSLSVVLAIGGILWSALQPASAHWLVDLRANLAGNSMPGSVNDPHKDYFEAVNLADLQALAAPVLPRAAQFQLFALVLSGILFVAWVIPAVRMRNGLPKHLLALACMAVFTLLPIYHRQYDSRLLLLALPAVAWLVAWRPRSWGAAAVVLTLAAIVVMSHQYIKVLTTGHFGSLFTAGGWKTVFVFRPLPLAGVVLMLFFLAAFWAAWQELGQVRAGALTGEGCFPAGLAERDQDR